MLTDAHCHLSLKESSEVEVKNLISRAHTAGVTRLINVGAGDGLDGNLDALEVSRFDPSIYATVGVHPHDAEKVDELARTKIEEWAKDSKVVAIGECGLDFYYEHSPRDLQREVFCWQIKLAKKLNKALVIHDREAKDETYEILKREGMPAKGVQIHCFTGSFELAKKYVELGCYLSFTGIITFKKTEELQEVVKWVPLDRFLVETDSPYLAPIPFRGKKNEPAYVQYVAEKISAIKQLPVQEIARLSYENTSRLFGIL